MNPKKTTTIFVIAGLLLLLVVGSIFLLSAPAANAQCGSQASSCKNCHETQAKDPVNNDSTTWHSEHSFGDFCYLCHAGNNQAMDETAAHTGMVDPIADYVTSCKGCHPDDFESLAQTYADTLGVALGSASSAAAGGGTNSPNVPSAPVAPVTEQTLAVPAADLVDYSQRYMEIVEGKKPLNVGNLILILIIAGILVGGGYFVMHRENLVKVSFQETKQIKAGYPADVVEMMPAIARLKPGTRKDLQQLLSKPARLAEAFALLNKLMDGNKPSREDEDKEQK
jgi:hypothetical protein